MYGSGDPVLPCLQTAGRQVYAKLARPTVTAAYAVVANMQMVFPSSFCCIMLVYHSPWSGTHQYYYRGLPHGMAV